MIGGVAAIAHGASRMTNDVDLAMPFTPENLARLLDILRPHNPVQATRPELSLMHEGVEKLSGFRLLLIETDLGRLDAMPEVAPLGSYEMLATVEREVFGRPCKVLAIESLIKVKMHVARPKDLEVAHELKASLNLSAQEDEES